MNTYRTGYKTELKPNNKLPTILVFKFDIRKKSFNVEKEMGIGISKIVKNNKTYIVPLCEEFEV